MKRFQLYKKVSNGLMHVTSLLSTDLKAAEAEISKTYGWSSFDRKNYKLTGLNYERNHKN